jgi:nucleotide-binding universal stress UspA family protein
MEPMDKLTSILAVADAAPCGLHVLDKAVTLAGFFGATVDLVTSDPVVLAALATRCAERHYDCVTLSHLPPGSEPLQHQIVRRALERRPDLVIKAAAGGNPLRRWTLDDNDRWLANECPVPLLLATARPWLGAMQMAAAVDIGSPDSSRFARSILQSAGFLALASHAWLDVLYSEAEVHDDRVRMERAVKLSQLVREFHVGCERLHLFNGAPARTLPPVVEARRYDLLVLGAVTHRLGTAGWNETLSSKLVDATAGDVLLVKPEERRAARGNVMDISWHPRHAHLPRQLAGVDRLAADA